jgi:hypothetical protein
VLWGSPKQSIADDAFFFGHKKEKDLLLFPFQAASASAGSKGLPPIPRTFRLRLLTLLAAASKCKKDAEYSRL